MRPALSPLSSRVTAGSPWPGPSGPAVRVVRPTGRAARSSRCTRTPPRRRRAGRARVLRRSSLSAIARTAPTNAISSSFRNGSPLFAFFSGSRSASDGGAQRLAGALQVLLQLLVVEQRRRLLGAGGARRRRRGRTRRPRAGCRAARRPRSGAGRRGARSRRRCPPCPSPSRLARHSIAPLGSQVLFPASISAKPRWPEPLRQRAGVSALRAPPPSARRALPPRST